MRLHFAVGAFAVAAVVSFASPALAADSKVYPASGCTKSSSTGSLKVYEDGSIANSNALEWLDVVCPVVRDNLTYQWQSWEVTVLDRSNLGDVICALRAWTGSGGSYEENWVGSTGNSIAWQTLSGGQWDVDPALSTTFANTRYVLMCSLPPSSGGAMSMFSSYRVDEP